MRCALIGGDNWYTEAWLCRTHIRQGYTLAVYADMEYSVMYEYQDLENFFKEHSLPELGMVCFINVQKCIEFCTMLVHWLNKGHTVHNEFGRHEKEIANGYIGVYKIASPKKIQYFPVVLDDVDKYQCMSMLRLVSGSVCTSRQSAGSLLVTVKGKTIEQIFKEVVETETHVDRLLHLERFN